MNSEPFNANRIARKSRLQPTTRYPVVYTTGSTYAALRAFLRQRILRGAKGDFVWIATNPDLVKSAPTDQ
jgi:hypothetical protein